MSTCQHTHTDSCTCSALSSSCLSELPSLISFLVDLCLQFGSRAREQHSIAHYILSKWTPEIESHPATYSFLALRPGILLTNSTSLDVFPGGSPSKKRKITTHQKRRQRSEVGRRRTKSGDGSTKRRNQTCKSKSRKTISNDKILGEDNDRCSQLASLDEGVLTTSIKHQRSRRNSLTAGAKRPPAILAPKKSQSSHILMQHQRPSTTSTAAAAVKVTATVGTTQRPTTSHGNRSSSKVKSQTSDAFNIFGGKCIEQNKNNGDDALRRLFTAVEMTKDKTCLILLCRIICGYLLHCKTNESRRRLRDCVRLDAVGCCLRALRSLFCEPNTETNRIAEDTLANTLLYFSAKDRKFLLKVRLSGIVPMFVSRLPPPENATSCHVQSHHFHHFLPLDRPTHSLLPFSFSVHPTALFRLIALDVQCQKDSDDLPPLGSAAAIAKYNRQTETELTLNYQKQFAELITPAILPENVFVKDSLSVVEPGSKYETIARIWAQKTKGVVPFVKLPFPDLVECLTDGAGGSTLRNSLLDAYTEKDNNSAPINCDKTFESERAKQVAVRNIKLKNHEHNLGFKRRIVFDLDHLANSEPPVLLDNEDKLKIGAPVGDHLLFESRFESGNLHKAFQVSPTDYELVLAPDINHCGAHFQWFFFQLTDMRSDILYTFEIVNCAKNFSMFSKGMQPVLFSVIEAVQHKNPCWSRVGSSICYFCNTKLESDYATSNNVSVHADCQTSTQSVTKLPSHSNRQQTEEGYTTSKGERENSKEGKQHKGRKKQTRTASVHKTAETDAKRSFFTLRFTIQFKHEADVCYIAYHFPYTYSRLQATLERLISTASSPGIYVHRQRLTSTLCSNLVPLLTVTASPLEVKCREFVLITARVHPGEANSSWIMHGVINFLLSSHPLAIRARELFVFKLVPMLNPDGVINGSQRCSLSGHDLNRVWNDPSPALHPTIYHAKGLIQYMVDLVRKRPYVFVDLHGHSRKANVFMYGNNSGESWRQSDRDGTTDVLRRSDALLPQILDNISDSFALKDCAFSITKNKEFSARVATWRQFGLEHAYTMESTYCGFDQGSKIGRQIMMEDMKLVGADLVKALVKLRESQ